jgi:hypothetical protein
MKLRVGARYYSAVCETQVIVVSASNSEVDLTCGGQPMLETKTQEAFLEIDPILANGALLGKRYGDGTFELLVVKAGTGTLTVRDVPLEVLKPRQLPSSD